MKLIPLSSTENIEHSTNLFVEDKFSQDVLNCLLGGVSVSVEPLGSNSILKSVAYSPSIAENTFFLIDRDHYPYCSSVPTQLETKDRLITWPKREMENYFLDANFLVQLPKYILNASKDMIEEKILEICQKRFFGDVAEYVMKSLRMEMRIVWDNLGSDITKCLTREDALNALFNLGNDSQGLLKQYSKNHLNKTSLQEILDRDLDAWKTIQTRTNQLTEQPEIEHRFNYYQKLMAGGLTDRLVLGKGEWLNMTDGKKVLNELVNNTGFFLNNVTVNDVAKQLLREPGVNLPDDFINLRNTIIQRTKQIIN